ncbi:Transcription initiation factor TFIID subunit 9 [Blyttiomyces sp. JEL0837]|nr:Transcription initiation factor TFIID subunit 9 [Blyttiomyces sp. JEL0837]
MASLQPPSLHQQPSSSSSSSSSSSTGPIPGAQATSSALVTTTTSTTPVAASSSAPAASTSASAQSYLPSSVTSTYGAHQDPLSIPRDAKLISLLIQAMGVEDYDPRVLPQLLEFMHRYVLDVLSDAQLFSEHAGRNEIDVDDVRLAVEGKISHSFTGVPSHEVLMELAEARNSIPLPPIPDSYGLRLPHERHTLTGVNFQIIPKAAKVPPAKKPKDSTTGGSSQNPVTPSNLPPTPSRLPAVQLVPPSSVPAPPPIVIEDAEALKNKGTAAGAINMRGETSGGRSAMDIDDDYDYDEETGGDGNQDNQGEVQNGEGSTQESGLQYDAF